MAEVTSDTPSSFRGYQWPHAGAVVEMPDDEAAELLGIAGPAGGYSVVPAKKAAARKPVAEPAPNAGEFSEVAPEGSVAEAKPKPAAPARTAAK